MDYQELAPLAEHVTAAYSDIAIYRDEFFSRHNNFPNTMAKVQHMRSALQASLTADDRFEVSAAYSEFGKVQVVDLQLDVEWLLRSKPRLAIELATKGEQLDLLPHLKPVTVSPVRLLVYEFTASGMELSIADTYQLAGRRRLEALGELQYVGLWPYDTTETQAAGFKQDPDDPFGDIGDIGDIDLDLDG